jgi:hypothetical protein
MRRALLGDCESASRKAAGALPCVNDEIIEIYFFLSQLQIHLSCRVCQRSKVIGVAHSSITDNPAAFKLGPALGGWLT